MKIPSVPPPMGMTWEFPAANAEADSPGAAWRRKKFSKLSGLDGSTGNNSRMRISTLQV